MASSRRPSEPRTFPSTGFKLIDPSISTEEELIPNYIAQRYYPVRIGEVFNKRYQVVGKLGHGSSSTVWLRRDLVFMLKTSKAHRELPIYNHLNQIHSNHVGRGCLRMLLDSFEITGPYGRHVYVLRTSVRQLLAALDYLHKEAHSNNILMGIDDESVLFEYEKDEFEHQVPRKVVVLCDLGEAPLGHEEYQDDIIPDVYRAPEVILSMKWSYKVDIWNVAMVEEYDDVYHLAEMVAILGRPPLDFLKRSENSLRYWEENDNWRDLVPIPDISLEYLERRLEGKNKDGFYNF
ncbi:protein kinase [Thermoascus aurantiacus ATCC 26904]